MKRFLITLAVALVASFGAAQDFEVGYAFDAEFSGIAPFVYVTEDFYLGEIGFIDTQLWFSPSVEVVFRTPIEGFAQAQFLLDAPPFTVSARAKYEFDQEFDIRVGVLFEL